MSHKNNICFIYLSMMIFILAVDELVRLEICVEVCADMLYYLCRRLGIYFIYSIREACVYSAGETITFTNKLYNINMLIINSSFDV